MITSYSELAVMCLHPVLKPVLNREKLQEDQYK